MYRLKGIIVGRLIFQNNLARREAMLVHPRFQVVVVVLHLALPAGSGGNDGITAGEQGVGVGGATVTPAAAAEAVVVVARGERVSGRRMANWRGEEEALV